MPETVESEDNIDLQEVDRLRLELLVSKIQSRNLRLEMMQREMRDLQVELKTLQESVSKTVVDILVAAGVSVSDYSISTADWKIHRKQTPPNGALSS